MSRFINIFMPCRFGALTAHVIKYVCYSERIYLKLIMLTIVQYVWLFFWKFCECSQEINWKFRNGKKTKVALHIINFDNV